MTMAARTATDMPVTVSRAAPWPVAVDHAVDHAADHAVPTPRRAQSVLLRRRVICHAAQRRAASSGHQSDNRQRANLLRQHPQRHAGLPPPPLQPPGVRRSASRVSTRLRPKTCAATAHLSACVQTAAVATMQSLRLRWTMRRTQKSKHWRHWGSVIVSCSTPTILR